MFRQQMVGLLIVAISGTVASAALTTSYMLDGNVGAEVAAFAGPGSTSSSGSLTLSSAPTGATIHRATLYANDYFGSGLTPSATFAGTSLGSTTAFSTDSDFSAFQWDVTGLVTGASTYTASASGFKKNYGLALVVAYSHSSLASGRVLINDGAEDLFAGDVVSTTFAGLSGPGSLWVHTGADNNGFSESGEVISFNGTAVGGPIDYNIGEWASLLQMPVTIVDGTNTASIDDPFDRFGWDLAVLVTAHDDATPEPSTLIIWSLLGTLGIGVSWYRKRRS